MPNINLLTIFLTGLLTGGLSCMAVQGGLLATTIAQREEDLLKEKSKKNNSVMPILSFLTTKLLAYTILGFLLGWFGSLFRLSITAQVIMQILVVIFMIGTALNMLEVHPIFRYFAIQPPRFLTKLVRRQSKSKDLFAPAILGAFTVFIPCGITQAMMALAIASGNPILGSAIMFSFVLGTAPVFFILGYFMTKFSSVFQGKFMKFAAFAIVILALFNLNNALALTGHGISFDNGQSSAAGNNQKSQLVATEATITIDESGYIPDYITLKAGSKVTLNLVNKNSFTCASAFTIPQYNIQTTVSPGTSRKVEFTTPDESTRIAFMCSMGMYRGYINVVKS